MSFLENLLDGIEVEWKKLKDVCSDFIVPMRDRPKVFDGDTPWCRIEDKEGQYFNRSQSGLGVSNEVIKKMNLKVYPIGTVICSCSASIGSYAINTKPLITNQTFIGLVCEKTLFNKYLLHYMETQTNALKQLATTGTIPYISRNKFEEFLIPIPSPGNPKKSLEIQKEIVRVLDSLTERTLELTTELTTELIARKKEYNYYREHLFGFKGQESELRPLGEIGEVKMCKRILKNETKSEGNVPFYKIGTFGKQADAYISKEIYDLYKSQYSFPKKGDVLISASGTIGRAVIYNGEPAYFQDSNIVWIDNDESVVSNKYLWHFYKIAKWFVSGGGTIDRLYNANIRKTLIPVPYPNNLEKSKAEQERIVKILDKFNILNTIISESLRTEIKLRRTQYEYYRDMLITFPKDKLSA